jgi:hypothetical protein
MSGRVSQFVMIIQALRTKGFRVIIDLSGYVTLFVITDAIFIV